VARCYLRAMLEVAGERTGACHLVAGYENLWSCFLSRIFRLEVLRFRSFANPRVWSGVLDWIGHGGRIRQVWPVISDSIRRSFRTHMSKQYVPVSAWPIHRGGTSPDSIPQILAIVGISVPFLPELCKDRASRAALVPIRAAATSAKL
jgi:hypothetical protein